MIRDAIEEDFPEIAAIYNDVLRHSTAIYRDEPVPLEERLAWWRGRVRQGYPVIVDSREGQLAGFASFGDFRGSPGYRYTVEHSVHVAAAWRGQGAGSALVNELIARAAAMGKHVMIGGIDADNTASVRFHERLGFRQVAHFRQVGYKFDRYLDLLFVQLILNGRVE